MCIKRARDTSRTGFVEWAFMSTHSWGELASGLWILDIDNDGWDGLYSILFHILFIYSLRC